MKAPSRWALAVAALLVLGGCRKRRPPAELEVPAPPTEAPIDRVPVDRALPGELAEGPQKAFGFPLPRVVIVRARFEDLVIGLADVSADRVANYVRPRVAADKIETGPLKTVFSRVTVRSQPGVLLDIEVVAHGGSTEIRVRNLPTAKLPDDLTNEQRWRAAGFNPDGTLLNPKHLR